MSVCAQVPTWRLVVDNYPPYVDELAQDRGVLSHVVTSVLNEQRIAAQIEIVPWQHIATEAAKPNSASFLWFESADLKQQWYFSEAITALQQVFVVRKTSSLHIRRLDELRGLRIGVTENYFYGERFAKVASQLTLMPASSDFANLQRLLAGQLDTAIMDPVMAFVMMQQLPKAQQGEFKFLSAPVLTNRPVYLVCSRNFMPCADFVQAFNRGLAEFKAQQKHLTILGPGVQE